MHSALGLAISVLCILSGAVTLVCPQTVSHLQENADTTPEQAVWQIRVGAVFMVLFGAALLYSICTWNGQAVEFIGV
jgi:uncharacterized protein YjeT (DUF2065 family)